ncbi:MAG: TonB-dependent receptor [Acidobacteriota bacterium]
MSRFRFGAALLCCLASLPALAFEGRLISPDGRPFAGARVQILGMAGSTVTDAEGRFSLSPDPEPPFALLVSRSDGVALSPLAVTGIPPGGVLELTVQPALAETLTVVSAATADLELPPAAAFTLVGRTDIEQRGPQHLADLLENTAGASGLERSHDAVPAIRGLTASRTLILIDDTRVTSERRAGASATFLDPLTTDEVEIVRGPGTVAYGSDAFGGVIRARTRIPSASDPITLRYTLIGAAGTGEEGGAVEVGAPLLGGGFIAGIGYRSFDDYDSPEGEVFNSAAEFRSMRLGYQHVLGSGNLRLLWRTDLGRDIGKPAIDSNVTQASYPEENSHRFTLHFDRPGPGAWSRLSLIASWDRYQVLTDRDRLPTATSNRQSTRADVDAQDFGLRVEAERALGRARLIIGLDTSGRFGLSATNTTYSYGASGAVAESTEETSIDSARREDLAAFVGVSRSFGPVATSAGLRLDQVSSKNSGGYFGNLSTSDSALSGFAAATVGVGGGFELAVQAARGFRDALLSDRYYRGISGRGFITGNPDLDPETSNQYDVALRWADGPWRVALYGFHYRLDGLIERYKSGSDYFFRNRGGARLTGAELEGSIELPHGLVLQGGLQTEGGEVAGSGAPIDGIPPRGGFLALRHQAGPRWWWLARAASYVEDDRPGPTEQPLPGYTVFDAGAGFRVSQALELQLLGRNLLDRAYRDSADEASVLAPGRSIRLTLRGQI